MTKVNMILVLSLVSQLLVGSVYSTRTDSTFDQLKETAYNSFGTVKDFAGNSMETVKDTASGAIGSVKNKVWPSYAPADAPSDAPATSPHHGGHHNQHNHHHKFHADAPVPISATGKYGFADDSAGSMHEAKQVHKVTMHASMHGNGHGFVPGNKAYNDVTGDPDRAVKEWGKGSGYTGAHHHDKGKWASAPKSSTMQERILRESYKQKAHHTTSPAPTNAASPAHQKAHDGSGEKIHTTIHTASQKFDDVTGDATSTFHNWAKDGHGHGKAAPVPKSSATHNRRLGESHHGKATPGKHSPSPSPAPTNVADHSHDKHKPHAKSPSPKTSGDYADAILHNTIHTAVNHKFSDVTGDATATFHDWAKDGHYKGGAASPKPSTKHVQGHGRGLGESHKGKGTAHEHPDTPSSAPTIAAGPEHPKSHPSPKSQDDSHKRIHVTIHTAANGADMFNDVTGDAASTIQHWVKDGHGAKGTKSHAFSPKHAPAGAPLTHERHLRESGPHHTPAHAGEHSHHGQTAPAPAPFTNGHHKAHKGTVLLAVNEHYNTAQAAYNDVTGDDVAAHNDWESHKSHGSHQ